MKAMKLGMVVVGLLWASCALGDDFATRVEHYVRPDVYVRHVLNKPALFVKLYAASWGANFMHMTYTDGTLSEQIWCDNIPYHTYSLYAPKGKQIKWITIYAYPADPSSTISTHIDEVAWCDENTDSDGDGVSNLAEFYAQTDPFKKDTDNDGLTDGYEMAMGSDPLDPVSGQELFTERRTLDGASEHSLLIRDDGTVWAWGSNSRGQLGDGTTVNRSTPGSIPGLANIVEVDAEQLHSVALTADGKVYVWGDNEYGDLGLGSSKNFVTQPLLMANLPEMKSVAAGYYHNLGLTREGKVWAWGGGWEGELGVGIRGTGTQPVELGLTDVIAIAAGARHSMALKSDGTVWTWGRNDKGQIGDGTTVNRSFPTMVEGLPRAVAIADGVYFSMALCADGSVWAWGNNANGQLGVGTTINSLVPVRVQIPNNEMVLAIDAGHSTAMALVEHERPCSYKKVLQLDGVKARMSAPDYQAVKNSFTVEFMVKAARSHEIDAQSNTGYAGTSGQKFLLWPNNGGSSAVGVGVSMGVEGVSVYEHGSSYMPAVLVARQSLGTDWNHVAVVYADKQARLYINGRFVKAGEISLRNNASPGNIVGGGSYGYFEGQVDYVRIWNYARSGAEISQCIAEENVTGQESGLVGCWTFANGTAQDVSISQKHGTLLDKAVIVTASVPVGNIGDRGTVYVWGAGANGQLGGNSTADSLLPIPLAGMEEAGLLPGCDIILGAGGWHNLAAKRNQIYSWGVNHNGQLGYPTTFTHRQPVNEVTFE
jgi:alpha-tubulin suppressor-like RCC1 family protein